MRRPTTLARIFQPFLPPPSLLVNPALVERFSSRNSIELSSLMRAKIETRLEEKEGREGRKEEEVEEGTSLRDRMTFLMRN